MADTAAPRKRLTVREFLEWEDRQPRKHELFDGQIRSMAGGTQAHEAIATNILTALRQKLRGQPCRPRSSDLKTQTEDNEVYYPDVTVDCGKGSASSQLTTEPTIIFEVFSKTTRKSDFEEKLPSYQGTASIRQIVYVEADEMKLHVWRRKSEGSSDAEEIYAGKPLALDPIGVTLSFSEIYEDVDLAE